MKQLSLVLNLVLIIAVGVLFYLHFSTKSEVTEAEPSTEQVTETTSGQSLPIAWVEIDTLLNNMDMYKDLSENLAKKQQKMEAEFSTKFKNFQKEVSDFQNKVQKGLMTSREAQERDQQLSQKRMDLENQRNDYLRQLQEENTVSQNKVIDYIMEYLKDYNKDNKYKYILSFSFGGGVLYADDQLEITDKVLVGINQKYAAEQAAGK